MLATDPSARVYGWAKCLYDKGLDPEIDLPMLTQVTGPEINETIGELWVGGAGIWPKAPHSLPEDFHYVLQLTKKEHFLVGPSTYREVLALADTAAQGFDEVDALATQVAARVAMGQKVLVHCQAGMNRSGLVAAAAMVQLGWTPNDAIAHLRDVRGEVVLCNDHFADYIRSLA
jgi:hypothetical protein